ncbi:phage terminase small subunit [Megamonas funiformis]|uniref:Terminase small subunit n=1 Tax=Siphoviridae sp. ctmAU6 TaxID=2826451 RepID=A0A8S5MG03_9CAUD|nr:phage terminase small subunit [Megamonas funiformis]DAD80843.1 MAG TPA: hypothetical protein [Siphoviridae sp. ctmAU6]
MAYDEKIKKKVQILYEKGSTFKAILEQYKIPAKTVRQWASKYKWEREKGSKKTTETKRKVSSVCIGKLQNTNAVKHGLFSKYLPAETLELVGSIEAMSPLDILWENICLKYAAIIRSQKIMYVKDDKDVTKRITMDGAEATVYQYKEAYEKQASFLIAQSRAMGTLMSLIKQYEEMCNSELATEEQKLRIEKLKTEITKATDEEPVKVEIIDNISNVEVNTNANKFE